MGVKGNLTMFIAHLPAGYLLSRRLAPRPSWRDIPPFRLMMAGLIGSVFPDIDWLWDLFVDHGMRHHHTYPTHLPLVWLTVLAVALPLLRLSGKRVAFALAVFFSANVFTHLLLDSVAGDIWWLWPFVDKPYALVKVPPLYHPWILSFVLHWSFGLELAIGLAACVALRRDWLTWRKFSIPVFSET